MSCRLFCAALLLLLACSRSVWAGCPTGPGTLGLAIPFAELTDRAHGSLEAKFAAFAAAGARWVRTDVWWDHVQPYPQRSMDWSILDRVTAAARRHGICLLGVLQGLPDWVAHSGSVAAPANRAAYARFVGAAARHFAGRILAWEIWNEPNLSDPWGGPSDAAAYTRLLAAAYRAIHNAAPDAVVVSGGLSPAPASASGHIGAVAFLQQMYAAGAAPVSDAIGFHPYSWPLLPKDRVPWNGWQIMASELRAVMVKHNDAAKQIWITEYGAPTAGGREAVSPVMQAAMLRQAEMLAREAPWAGPLLWYSWRDRGGRLQDTENWYGLIDPLGNPKPAFNVYRDLGVGTRARSR